MTSFSWALFPTLTPSPSLNILLLLTHLRPDFSPPKNERNPEIRVSSAFAIDIVGASLVVRHCVDFMCYWVIFTATILQSPTIVDGVSSVTLL